LFLNYRRNEDEAKYLFLNYRRNEDEAKYLFLNYRRNEDKANYFFLNYRRNEDEAKYLFLNYRRNEDRAKYFFLNYRRNEDEAKYLFLNYRRNEDESKYSFLNYRRNEDEAKYSFLNYRWFAIAKLSYSTVCEKGYTQGIVFRKSKANALIFAKESTRAMNLHSKLHSERQILYEVNKKTVQTMPIYIPKIYLFVWLFAPSRFSVLSSKYM
jgi:hypothetical protein